MREFMILSLFLVATNLVAASYYSYERTVNSIDDGSNKITNYQTKNYDSSKMQKPRFEGKTVVLPSKYKNSINSLILRKQRNTNNVGTGFEFKMPTQLFNSYFGGDRGGKHKSRARSVESPAYSVDSGGRASSSIAGEIAKILHVKQGHYADVYSRIDRPDRTTRRPVDAIEDTMKVAGKQAWVSRDHSQ